MTTFKYSSHFDAPAEALFEFHSDVRNLARISPSFPRFTVISDPKLTEEGDLQRFRLSAGPFGVTWEARVVRLVPGRLVEDVQERGPFREWRHQHQIAADGEGSRLTDAIAFRLLPTIVGEFIEYWTIRPLLILSFKGRHRATARELRGDGR